MIWEDLREIENVERRVNERAKLIKYLLEKKKRETLAEKAAYHVARHIKSVEDVNKLEIPFTLHSLVTKFFEY